MPGRPHPCAHTIPLPNDFPPSALPPILQTEFTKLVPQLEGIDPDDAFSSVPYEKGFSLLYAIASAVGEDRFGAFMHDYFQ